MILKRSGSSEGLWSSVSEEKLVPFWELITALESPVLAIQMWSSITSMTMAQLPDLSLTDVWFWRMNISSASLKPFLRASSGFEGKLGWLAMILCKLSRRNSAQPWPPWPSNTAKKLAYFMPWAKGSSGLDPGFLRSRTMLILSSL